MCGTGVGFSVERERNKQIGTQDVVVNTLNRQPNVDLTIDYIFNPMLLNERSLGFDTSEKKPPAFSDIKDKSYNFLLLKTKFIILRLKVNCYYSVRTY